MISLTREMFLLHTLFVLLVFAIEYTQEYKIERIHTFKGKMIQSLQF